MAPDKFLTAPASVCSLGQFSCFFRLLCAHLVEELSAFFTAHLVEEPSLNFSERESDVG